jgi:hypothetical protein
MKLALLALLALSFSGCVRSTLNTHREVFEPTKRHGAWAQYERDIRNHKDPADPSKRALFRETE